MRRLLLSLLATCLAVLSTIAQGQVLESIRASKHLACGAVMGVDDWNGEDLHGNLSALEAEVCRAVAVAILGDASAVTIQNFPAEPEALNALKAGTIQLAIGVTPSASTAVRFGVGFGPPIFYDSQRLMVTKRSGVTDIAGLRDKLICAIDTTPPERVLREEMTARGIPYGLMAHSEQGEMDAAVAVRRCEAATAMESRLTQSRASFHAPTSDFVFLPERFGLNPVVPAYRYGDQTFGLVIDWTIGALIEAEALGITQENVTASAKREDMRAEQLLGHDFATAQALGLAHDWAAKVIAATGNYGEIFQRTAGRLYHLDRGLNALWTEGGLMRPLPMK
jgi:general L-amino acid transport system substrate-binding protein